ncbi:hypothetical protein ACH4GZ_22920 [Streptomyces hygroscopicus]|uniref:hypothetical protein n=1 Tax=Streptomyces hygroscopicus TaxID=1912 RepID=UPI0037B4280B
MPSFETFGALHLRYTIGQDYRNGLFWSSARSPIYQDRPNGDANFWFPTPPRFGVSGEFRPLGSYGRHYGRSMGAIEDFEFKRDGKAPQLMIAPVAVASGVVASPVGYERLWYDKGTGATLDGSVWRPIPPAGYVALGDVWMAGGTTAPPRNAVYCVKQGAVDGHTYVRRAELRELVWKDQGTGGSVGDIAVWRPDVPPITEDTSERLLLAPNTVTTVPHYGAPAPTPTSWILDVPAAVEKRPEPPVPALTSHQEPVAPQPVTDRIVRVPFTGVEDPGRTLEWKIENSPFYRLHRRVGYSRAIFTNNQHGTQPAPAREEVTTGISREESEAFSQKTSITVSASVGVAYKALSASAGVSVTRETGYERRTAVTEFTQKATEQGMVTPPRASGILWVKSHELLLHRADDTLVANGLPFRFPSYAIATYPPDAAGQHIEAAEPGEPEFQQAPDIDWEKGGGIPGFDAEELTKKLELLKQEMPEQS